MEQDSLSLFQALRVRAAQLDNLGTLVRLSEISWGISHLCELCGAHHQTHEVELLPEGQSAKVPLKGSVWLSDGIISVVISFQPACLDRPFENLANQISRALKMPVLSDHQVFDSIEHLYQCLSHSAPGEFFGWDEPTPSNWELYESEMGHLLKFNYKLNEASTVLDVVLEFEEYPEVMTDYQGVSAGRFGTLITILGGTAGERRITANLFQSVLDDYARLLAPATFDDISAEI
jgi:hypothetical protein